MEQTQTQRVMEETKPLIRRGAFETAAAMVAAARDGASGPSEAASLSVIAGSYFSAAGNDSQALALHEEAERLAPGEPNYPLATARQLMRMHRWDVARSRIEEVLALTDLGAVGRHRALAALCLLEVRSGSADDALRTLASAHRVAQENSLSIDEWDLDAVSELVKAGNRHEACAEYLNDLANEAHRVGDDFIERRAGEIRAKLI